MMRRVIAFWRIIKTGFRNFFRNLWLSTAATAIMVVTLTIILTGAIINMAFSAEIDRIVSDIKVSVYLNKGVTDKQIQQLEAALEKEENTKEITFVSANEALATFQERYKDSPELLEGLTVSGNSLPASFEVSVYDLSNIDPIIALTENEQFAPVVEETSYNQDRQARIEKIDNAQEFITRFSAGAGIIFAVISVLIIFNTIRMAIYTRAKEIRIMQLVGATNTYIRGPFLFEAMLYGIVAGSIALSVVYSFLNTLGPELNRHIYFDSTLEYFTTNWPLVAALTIGLGALVGAVSSLLAMMRHLKL